MHKYRLQPLFFVFTVMVATCCHADTLTIFNTSDHAVVIGVYEHTENGIKETLIPVNSMTEMRKIPILYNGSDHFAVAYRAETVDGKIARVAPTIIHGMRKIYHATDREQSDNQETVLQYRAGRLFPERDSFGTNLYTARGDGESIKKEVNHAHGKRINKIDYQATN